MSDNTKIKERLGYSSLLGYIVGSTLPSSEVKVTNNTDIYNVIDLIKQQNAIGIQVRLYLLQVRNFIIIYLNNQFFLEY